MVKCSHKKTLKQKREKKMTKINIEKLEIVPGGTKAEADEFLKLAKEKDWRSSKGMASRMAANRMFEAIGIMSVNWRAASEEFKFSILIRKLQNCF